MLIFCFNGVVLSIIWKRLYANASENLISLPVCVWLIRTFFSLSHVSICKYKHYISKSLLCLKIYHILSTLCWSSTFVTWNKNVGIKFSAHDAVADLYRERPSAISLVRPLPIPRLHDWRKMEVCLINLSKGEDDERCLKFCNIVK